jgi:hypothetical protein
MPNTKLNKVAEAYMVAADMDKAKKPNKSESKKKAPKDKVEKEPTEHMPKGSK